MSRKLVRKAAELASALESVGVGFDTAQTAAEHAIVRAYEWGIDPCVKLDILLGDFDYRGRGCLWGLFAWEGTPEGHKFWYEVARG